jgi:hypothetical protein
MRWPKLAFGVANFCRPRAMVLRATPVASATAEMPPAPQALRFSRRQAPLTFVQKRFQAHKTFFDRSCIHVHHYAIAVLVDQIE